MSSNKPGERTILIQAPQLRVDRSYGSLPAFVGSPDDIDDMGGPQIHRTDDEAPPIAESSGSRPTFGRSVSSSVIHPSRPGLDTHSRILGVSNSRHRRTIYEHPVTREWSVFGELYEAEDQLRNSGLPRHRQRRKGSHHHVPGRVHSRSISHGHGAPSISITEETVQSPVDDPQLSSSVTDMEGNFSSDDESSRSTSASSDTRTPNTPPKTATEPRKSRLSFLALSPLHRNILKCAVAYFIASLFTFSPYLSGLISDMTNYGSGESPPSPSGHMVATVAVYFNPAKTLGGMVEADIFCLTGLLFAAFVSLSSMSMFWFFEVQPGWEWLADMLVLLWIGMGMSVVAYMKVWMAKPSFNTAIILFVVVVREGGLETLLQVSFVISCGALVSNVVCAVLWPQSAAKNLQDTMTKTLQSFATLLDLITETFLLEEPRHQLSHEKIQRAVDSHQASFTSLKKHFAEAQSEWVFGGPRKTSSSKINKMRTSRGDAYQDAIDSLNRLGQHLNGLRSGTALQADLIRAQRRGKLTLKGRSTMQHKKMQAPDYLSLRAKDKVDPDVTEDEEAATLQDAAMMFSDLMDDLGPPLRSLSGTCITTLKQLREAFVQPVRSDATHAHRPFQNSADSLQRALFTFESTSNQAVLRLYKSYDASGTQSRDSVESPTGENRLLTGADGESVFLVYLSVHPIEFTKELISLVDALDRLCAAEAARAACRGWWRQFINPFKFATRWRSSREKTKDGGLRKRLSAYFAPESRRKTVLFPKIKPHAPNTMQTPARSNLTLIGRFQQSLWALGARLREQDTKYAIKAGMATAMLAAPAFFDSTRPMFVHYRGEWALISFFVVISPTIGATNFLGVHRVLGTLLGAFTAAAIWTAFPEDPYVLSIFGFFFSIPCFYYIVGKPEYATSARFVLLTYNLTCLYCYNLRQKDIEVTDIAFHRALAVTVGVVWAAIVSRFWWPTEARRALGRALGDFCLNMGWLYTRLVAFNSFSEAENNYDLDGLTSSETTALLQDSAQRELHLQVKLIELQGLLAQTQHEPRLKGPFPVVLYRSILTSLQTILDKLHSMRCVTSREEWHTTVRRDFVLPVNRERREMVGNVILYFSTLAAAFRLKSPLPPYLPPAEEARLRLVDAIRKLDVVRSRDVRGSRQLLFFAYALTMKGVIQELNYLGHVLQEAFGVIGQSREEFEALFKDTERVDNTLVV
ncbi:uncharacterized protein FIBRA_06037 [Fibroporia radiculosa]|uniref:Uncharacterized protein n=1 Tax=Fibroporia radiculosa TaxID=599839 RepID=J4IB18_9APHY|nr:uncharacterized protein FIBRA_06037 [Fibroporia radiculosa]CCM03886.1 predicted protein [Fibroporia radiculosa]